MKTTMERPNTQRTVQHKIPLRSPKTLEERFEEHTDGYTLFGTIAGTRRYINPQCIRSVAQWIASRTNTLPEEEVLNAFIDECAHANPSWFLHATAVRLAKQSRTFAPGLHIFQVTRNFSRIQDVNAPQQVHDCYTRAIFDHPQRNFLYLEPLWRTVNGKRTPTTTNDFKLLLTQEHAALVNMIPRIQRIQRIDRAIAPLVTVVSTACSWVMNALCFIVLSMLIVLTVASLPLQMLLGTGNAVLHIPQTLAQRKEKEALRKAGFYPSAHGREMTFLEAAAILISPIDTETLSALACKYDPIIAIEFTDFDSEHRLGLVIHWDDDMLA